MKKILLSLVAVLTAMTMSAAEKTVTFDFNTNQYGKTLTDGIAAFAVGDKITNDGVTVTATACGTTPVRFYTNANTGVVTLRMGKDCAIAIEAGGANITEIAVTGSNVGASNVSADSGTWSDSKWEGSAAKVTLTRIGTSTDQFQTMAVTYEAKEEETPTATGDAESFVFATWDTENSVCVPNSTLTIPTANTAADSLDGSYMKMNQIAASTANMDVIFTSGPISQSVQVNETADPTSTDPGFKTFYQNFYKLDKKNDFGNKDGQLEPVAFVQGYGNPCADQTHTPYYNEEKSKWAVTQVFTYYQPDGSAGLPTNGSYLEFTPKKDGQLTTRVYVPKGNRPFYIVDKETKCALDTTQYSAWGCANGQKTADGTCLRYEQLSHGIVPVTETVGEKLDTIGWKPNYCLWFSTQKANQHIVADVTFNVSAGKTYMMFCGNTQIGISSFTFVPVGDATGIATIEQKPVKVTNVTYNLAGQVVDESYKGVVIRNGRKYINK